MTKFLFQRLSAEEQEELIKRSGLPAKYMLERFIGKLTDQNQEPNPEVVARVYRLMKLNPKVAAEVTEKLGIQARCVIRQATDSYITSLKNIGNTSDKEQIDQKISREEQEIEESFQRFLQFTRLVDERGKQLTRAKSEPSQVLMPKVPTTTPQFALRKDATSRKEALKVKIVCSDKNKAAKTP